ncbi:MAG: adenylate/guanylate cyclase domain-containing protein, partial [Myxococcota bacterium]|nr:adenylate/guanylate cyclase domain-containing protein [Myxococcota bacterium]
MTKAPTGEIAIIFTDVEGSTALWDRIPDAMHKAIERHDELLRRLLVEHRGYEVKSEGDAFMAAFAEARDAVEWCLQAQRLLLTLNWPGLLGDQPESSTERRADGSLISEGLRVRMGGHIGRPNHRKNPTTGRMDYFGGMVNRAARISHAGHGGQIVLSQVLSDRAGELHDCTRVDLGCFKLTDLSETEQLVQILPQTVADRCFPSLRATPFRRPQIGLPSLPLLGRDTESAELLQALRQGHRQILLKGPPGMGKSHLARSVTSAFQRDTSLAGIELTLTDQGDLETVLTQVGSSLGLPLGKLQGSDGVEAQIPHAIRAQGKAIILIHDWDQLEPLALGVLQRWHDEIDSVCLLFTGQGHPDSSSFFTITLGPVDADGAVDIFVDSARRQLGGFSPSAADQKAIAQMGEELDGSPLAIRLTAGRLKELRPNEILNLLPHRLPLLANTQAQSARLDLALSLSWEGLTEAEKNLVQSMAWVPAALTTNLIHALIPRAQRWSLEQIRQFIHNLDNRSLLVREGEEAGDEPVRWSLLKSVRRFVKSQMGDA